MKYIGTAVVEKGMEVEADDENDARLAIIDLADEAWPDADLYLVKEVEKVNI